MRSSSRAVFMPAMPSTVSAMSNSRPTMSALPCADCFIPFLLLPFVAEGGRPAQQQSPVAVRRRYESVGCGVGRIALVGVDIGVFRIVVIGFRFVGTRQHPDPGGDDARETLRS